MLNIIEIKKEDFLNKNCKTNLWYLFNRFLLFSLLIIFYYILYKLILSNLIKSSHSIII